MSLKNKVIILFSIILLCGLGYWVISTQQKKVSAGEPQAGQEVRNNQVQAAADAVAKETDALQNRQEEISKSIAEQQANIAAIQNQQIQNVNEVNQVLKTIQEINRLNKANQTIQKAVPANR